MSTAGSNTLGLDFDQTKAEIPAPVAEKPKEEVAEPATPVGDDATKPKSKPKPYVNPERVKTGGSEREKLSDEALTERMARIKEQNEKIKQRRVDIQADEDAFKKTQEVERQKQAQHKRVQENIDRAREQNAKRKMDKVQSREWDSGKAAPGERRSAAKKQPSTDEAPSAPTAANGPTSTSASAPAPAETVTTETVNTGEWTRGGSPRGASRGRSRGRGRGRGRGSGPSSPPPTDDKLMGQAI